VDSNKSAEAITAADERETGARVYTYMVKPIDVLDIGFSKDGELNWILVREYVRDDADPITSSGKVFEQYRLWTRYDWSLFTEEEGEGGDKIVSLIDHGEHGLGIVPCFPVTHVIGNHRYKAPSLIDDTAYLDRAVANYLSNLDAIIQDQTFSQLVMPAQGLLPGDEKYDQLLEMGTKRIFTYDGEAGAEPKYISPDAGQARLIVEVVNKIIAEIYHTIGMAGERTKQDNAVGIDNSSGVAKAYDFERVNSLLASKAASLENAENRLVNLVLKWHGKSEPEQELVKYPQTFDVRSLYDEFTIAERLALIEAPAEVRREQMVQVIDKLFPAMSRALIDKMKAELKDWGETPEPEAPPTKFGESRKNAQTENRQGQVTADTKTSQ